MQRAIFTLEPTPPYDFALTAAYATYFRGRYGADSFEGGAYRRLLDVDGRLALATVRASGTVAAPRLEVELVGPELDEATVAGARRQVAWMLGTGDDLAPFYRVARGDPHLAPLAPGLYGLHPPHTASVYEALVLAILGQQISTHVARMLRTLLIETCGPRLEVDGVTYHAFPRPATLAAAGVDGLRALKFSARKAEYIRDIAAGVASGGLDLEALHTLPDDEVVRVLTGIRGVGVWTAHWLFIRALGRPDGFPHGDLALQRTLGLLVNGGTPLGPQEAQEYSRRWSPYRTYVTVYLFAAVRSGRFAALAAAGQVGP